MDNCAAYAPPSAEPKNRHEEWCNIWTTVDKPCNCGAAQNLGRVGVKKGKRK